MSITTVRLQPDVEQGLQVMAGTLHRSKSWLINQALKEFIERQEQEKLRWQETLQAMESVAQGRVVSGESVHTWLNSWGSSNELSPPKASV
jgi:predicted transcriptional regulator